MHNVITENMNEEHRCDFDAIMEEWCIYVEKYTDYFGDDAVYWYNERASVGSFAAAAGKKDYFVLEEYAATKKSSEGFKNGRVDLFLSKKDRPLYILEAKQVRCPISARADGSTNKNKIKDALKQARSDAVNSKAEDKDFKAYGLVFVVPHIAKSFCEDAENLIEEFIKLVSGIDFDAMAYVFPENAETYTDSQRFYPGVVCLLRAPRRG